MTPVRGPGPKGPGLPRRVLPLWGKTAARAEVSEHFVLGVTPISRRVLRLGSFTASRAEVSKQKMFADFFSRRRPGGPFGPSGPKTRREKVAECLYVSDVSTGSTNTTRLKILKIFRGSNPRPRPNFWALGPKSWGKFDRRKAIEKSIDLRSIEDRKIALRRSLLGP